ncbi:MAG: LysR family transcriptional regulator [Sphingobium sp.]
MSGLSVHMLIRKVDLLTLRLFLSAIEQRQIGRAAAVENIAPSAATKRIHDLEELAGLRLLERNPKGVVPSRAGEVLARRLRTLFANLEDMRRELSEFTEGIRGHVRVGAPGTVIIHHLAREIGEFTQNFPFIDVEMEEDLNPAVIRAVKLGKVDIAIFVADPAFDCADLNIIHYRTEQMVVVYPIGHAFSEKASVTLADLMEERLIGILPRTTLMTRMREGAKAMGRTLEPKYTVRSVDVARAMVQAGLGVTIQPKTMLSMEDHEKVATVALDEPWAWRRFEIATRRDKPLSSAAQLLIKQLRSEDGSPAAEAEWDEPVPHEGAGVVGV